MLSKFAELWQDFLRDRAPSWNIRHKKLTGIDQEDQCGVAKRGSLLMKFLVVVLTDVQYVVIIIDQEGLFLISDIGIIFSSYLCDHLDGRIFLGKGEACQT